MTKRRHTYHWGGHRHTFDLDSPHYTTTEDIRKVNCVICRREILKDIHNKRVEASEMLCDLLSPYRNNPEPYED